MNSIQAYATAGPPPDVLLREDQRRIVVKALADVCAGSTSQDHLLRDIVDGVRGQKAAWEDAMRAGQAQVLAQIRWEERDPRERETFTFEMFDRAGAESLAEDFADAVGCAEVCRWRGLQGLLAVPAVHMFVGVALSQIFAQVVGHAGQPGVRLPHRNDGYDVWHAILGSTAERFLTFDRRLAGHLERIPERVQPRILRSVTELLQD